jgi:hypothetical protein
MMLDSSPSSGPTTRPLFLDCPLSMSAEVMSTVSSGLIFLTHKDTILHSGNKIPVTFSPKKGLPEFIRSYAKYFIDRPAN